MRKPFLYFSAAAGMYWWRPSGSPREISAASDRRQNPLSHCPSPPLPWLQLPSLPLSSPPSIPHPISHPPPPLPQDVLVTLLNNLKVQERQNRVCTTVAIAIVAETCAPFTVLPALMNEYRTPEINVQNGVLKALSFMFEYIGEMAKDYIYAVTPLLEDALMDRDLVGRGAGEKFG